MRTIIGISGASGAAISIEFIKRCPGEKYVVFSKWGKSVMAQETGLVPSDLSSYADRVYSNDDMNAPFSSGSNRFDQMVIIPCSVATLGRIANGISDNLISRMAEVALKENRKLLLGLRETPLSPIALENALKLSRLGVTIMPLLPAFYLKAQTPDQSVTQFVDHMFTTLRLPGAVDAWRANELPSS